ncbi:MAG: hypothetical protein AAB438_03905 [Patescibacteria group bacterium]
MEKFKFLSLFCVIIFATFGCKNNQQNNPADATPPFENIELEGGKAIEVSPESMVNYLEEVDATALKSKGLKHFSKKNAQVFFIKKWNTPSFFSDGEFDGMSWDGKVFFGTESKGVVYFPFEYHAYSEKFAQSPDSVFTIEKNFSLYAVTTDPRLSVWWMATLTKPENFGNPQNLEAFLKEATTVNDKKEFTFYIQKLCREIYKEPGTSWRAKVISYTKKVVPGNPNSWDAWDDSMYYDNTEEIGKVMDKIRK